MPPRLLALETIRLVHAQGGLAVAAHPELLPDLPVDAIEIVSNAGVFSWFYDAWAALRNVDWATS